MQTSAVEGKSFISPIACLSGDSTNMDSSENDSISIHRGASFSSIGEVSGRRGNRTEKSDSSSHHESFVTIPDNMVDSPNTRTTMKLRVENEASKRSKDLLLEIKRTWNLFDKVYDHPLVKKAHVRKWSSDVVKKVKSGDYEIQFAIWDDFTGKPCHTYSIDELKLTSTRQLYEIVPESDVIRVVLQCVEKGSKDTSIDFPSYAQTIHESIISKAEESKSDSGGNMSIGKCPFSGVEITHAQLEDFKRKMANDDSSKSYGEESIQSRKGELAQSTSYPPVRQSQSLAESGGEDVNSSRSLRSRSSFRDSDSIHGSKTSLDTRDSSVSRSRHREQSNTMRIRISNRVTERVKDLVVQIGEEFNLFDDVYNSSAVKDSHVRKWGSKIATMVKENKAEIVAAVWDDELGRPWRTYKIDDLKQMSTRQLYYLTPSSWNLVKVVLDCSLVENQEGTPSVSRVMKKTLSDDNVALPSIRSESYLRRAGAKRSTRLNHMNFGSRANATFDYIKPPGASSRVVATDKPTFSSESMRRILSMQSGLDSSLRKKNSSDRTDLGGIVSRSNGLDIDTLISSRRRRRRRSKSSDELDPISNEFWKDATDNKNLFLEKASIGAKVERFLEHSKEAGVPANSDTRLNTPTLKEFIRLCNTKKSIDCQSASDFRELRTKNNSAVVGSRNVGNDVFPAVVGASRPKENPILNRLNSTTLTDKRSNVQDSTNDQPNSNFSLSNGTITTRSDYFNATEDASGSLAVSPGTNASKVSDKINRFLRPSRLQGTGARPDPKMTADKASIVTSSKRSADSKSSPKDRLAHPSTQDTTNASKDTSSDMPPLAEIAVVNESNNHIPSSVSVGIGLSPAIVKEVFPYHVVIDSEFRVLQVGNLLSQLIEEDALVGRPIYEILSVCSPIPMYHTWDWNSIDKMKDQTLFLESVINGTQGSKVKIKGTVIEVSPSPRKVMLALFPNVKNLSELEAMNLSMADLPLHSCQREAVLLGEHSKSEVKLTNHLDHLHRDLINSMEKQIEDRTNELESANHELEVANSQLAIQSARQLEHFACMSHEIRTPLNCIVGMSSLLLDEVEAMDPMHSESVKMINTSGELLKAVVDDVLDYAKLESGSFEVDIKSTNLQDTLNGVVHAISPKVQEKNIRLRMHFSTTLPPKLETDSRRLQQVLFNLLGNAGKFSKRNSVIDLSVDILPGRMELDKALMEDFTSDSRHIIRFSVKDYGKGIRKDDFKKIFEPFSQASKETQNVYGGTGLGLSITSKLAHRLGGNVNVDSEIGKFTDFTVDLPLVGDLVDIEGIRKRFVNTKILVAEPKASFETMFSNSHSKPEPTVFNDDVVKIYGLDVKKFQSLSEACDSIEPKDPNHVVLLIHEDMFDIAVVSKLNSLLGTRKHTIITFGPQYKIDVTKERHLRSLDGMIPSVLLNSIARQIEKPIPLRLPATVTQQNGTKPHGGLFAPLAASPAPPQADSALGKSTNQGGGLFASLQGGSPAAPQASTVVNGTGPSSPATGGLFAPLKAGATTSSVPPVNGTSSTSSASGGLFAPLANTTPAAGGLFAPLNGNKANGDSSTVSVTNTATSSSVQDAPKQASKTPSAKSQEGSKYQHLKVMYAEDNVVNQKVLARALKRVGIEDIVIVDNGKEAVDLAAKTSFDCIFMDMQMPVMGGMEACQLILEEDPEAIVVFVTAHALYEFKAEADAVGAAGFISKPFRLDDIRNVLDDLKLQR